MSKSSVEDERKKEIERQTLIDKEYELARKESEDNRNKMADEIFAKKIQEELDANLANEYAEK
jgi:hypothetical protein